MSGLRAYKSIAGGFGDTDVAIVGGAGKYANARGEGKVSRITATDQADVGYRFTFTLAEQGGLLRVRGSRHALDGVNGPVEPRPLRLQPVQVAVVASAPDSRLARSRRQSASVTVSATRVYNDVHSRSTARPSGRMPSALNVAGSNTRVPWK